MSADLLIVVMVLAILLLVLGSGHRQTESFPAVVVMADQPARKTGTGCASTLLAALILVSLMGMLLQAK